MMALRDQSPSGALPQLPYLTRLSLNIRARERASEAEIKRDGRCRTVTMITMHLMQAIALMVSWTAFRNSSFGPLIARGIDHKNAKSYSIQAEDRSAIHQARVSALFFQAPSLLFLYSASWSTCS